MTKKENTDSCRTRKKAAEWEKAVMDILFSQKDRAVIEALGQVLRPSGKPHASLQETDLTSLIHILTDRLEIDNEGTLFLLALSILGYHSSWQSFGERIVPRLKGIHRYYQVRNAAYAPLLKEVLDTLEKAGIPVMPAGGTAMYAFYAVGAPRLMNGFDLTIPSGEFENACRKLQEPGEGSAVLFRKSCSKTPPADVPQNGDGSPSIRLRKSSVPGVTTMAILQADDGLPAIRFHRGVPDERLFSEKDLWKQAGTGNWLGHDVRIPSPEDMLLSLLCLPFAPWVPEENPSERNRRLYESCCVLSQGIDYSLLAEKSAGHGVQNAVHFYLCVLNRLMPGIVEESRWVPWFPSDRSYLKYIRTFAQLCMLVNPGSAQASSTAPSAGTEISVTGGNNHLKSHALCPRLLRAGALHLARHRLKKSR